MLRRTLVPLAMLAFVFGAFAASAWAMADGNDLGGLYWIAVGAVALKAQSRITAAGTV